jgi:hypothetical protein
MALKYSNIRAAIAEKIDSLAGFNEVKVPIEFIGRTQKTIAHLGFAIGINSSSDSGERQRRAIYYLNSLVTVKFMYRLRPLDLYPTDYDNCLDKEIDVVKAVLSSYSSIQNEMTIRFNSSIREISSALEFMIVTLTFNVKHTI